MYFDSHAHFDDRKFDPDRAELLGSMAANGISNICNIGADLKTSKKAVQIAEQYPFIYAAVGVHPSEVGDIDEGTLAERADLCRAHKKVVAIGEIGLDYHYDDGPSRDTQIFWFKKQMKLAWQLKKPVVIHSRDAMEDTIKVLKQERAHGGILHCFSGSWESAKIFLDLGYHISFAGPVTFKNSRNLPDVAAKVPDDRLLIETDCPYLAPEPHRGERNNSIYVKEVAKKLAEIRGTTPEAIAALTAENAKRLFGIQ